MVTLGVTSPSEGWDRATRSSRIPAEVAPGCPWREPVPATLGLGSPGSCHCHQHVLLWAQSVSPLVTGGRGHKDRPFLAVPV